MIRKIDHWTTTLTGTTELSVWAPIEYRVTTPASRIDQRSTSIACSLSGAMSGRRSSQGSFFDAESLRVAISALFEKGRECLKIERLQRRIMSERENTLSALREKPLKVFEIMRRANIANEESCQSLLLRMRDEGLIKFDIHKGQWFIAKMYD
jgi:hypothetical protein